MNKIQQKLLSIKDSTKCQISPAAELDVLQKVRTYISLNEDYQVFINQPDKQDNKESLELPDKDEKLFDVRKNKISY